MNEIINNPIKHPLKSLLFGLNALFDIFFEFSYGIGIVRISPIFSIVCIYLNIKKKNEKEMKKKNRSYFSGVLYNE